MCLVFFCKQKTAYEMRISDWSSDVCSSDLTFSMKSLLAGYRFPYAWNDAHPARVGLLPRKGRGDEVVWVPVDPCYVFHPANAFETADGKIGSASGRERVCQYV